MFLCLLVVSTPLLDTTQEISNKNPSNVPFFMIYKGNFVPKRTMFPSGIKALENYVHIKGLKIGIYSDAGYILAANEHYLVPLNVVWLNTFWCTNIVILSKYYICRKKCLDHLGMRSEMQRHLPLRYHTFNSCLSRDPSNFLSLNHISLLYVLITCCFKVFLVNVLKKWTLVLNNVVYVLNLHD